MRIYDKEEPVINYLANNLKILLIVNNMQNMELAELMGGEKVPNISNWITGKNTPPINKIQLMCKIFKITFDDFVNKEFTMTFNVKSIKENNAA